MVKTKGPMFSEGASGTIGNALVSSTWKGRAYVRNRVIPTNPKSAAQTAARAAMRFLTQAWAGISAPDKATWSALATTENVTPYNAFIRKNLTAIGEGNPPSTAEPPPAASTPPDEPTTTTAATAHEITLALAQGANAPAWAYAIYRSDKGPALVICDGNSLTLGYDAAISAAYPDQLTTTLGNPWEGINTGLTGQTTPQMITAAPTRVDPCFNAANQTNLVVCWEGTNDIYFNASATDAYNHLVTYCQARRTAGFKVVIATILPRNDFPGTSTLPDPKYTTFLSRRDTVNASIRANWATFADALADVAADARIGDAGDEANTTYYLADKVHMTTAGYAIVAPIIAAAIQTLTPAPEPKTLLAIQPIAGTPTTPIVKDSLQQRALTKLESHTGEIGATWTVSPNWPASIIWLWRQYAYGGHTSVNIYYASGVPPTADYTVEADFVTLDTSPTQAGIMARLATSGADEFIWAVWDSGKWHMYYRHSGGSATLFGNEVTHTPVPGRKYHLQLTVQSNSATLTVTQGGATIATCTGTHPVTATGRPGIEFTGSIADGTGSRIFNFHAHTINAPNTFTDTPPNAATWHYAVRGLNKDGIWGTRAPDAHATIA